MITVARHPRNGWQIWRDRELLAELPDRAAAYTAARLLGLAYLDTRISVVAEDTERTAQ